MAKLYPQNLAVWLLQVLSTKVEIHLKKRRALKWDTLEWTGQLPSETSMVDPTTLQQSSSAAGDTIANKRGPRDWDKLVVEIKEV